MSGISTTRRLRFLLGVLAPAFIAAACGRVKDPTMPVTTTVAALGARCGSGNICTVAGTGVAGDGEDGLPGLETRMYLPQDTTFGPDGRLYVVERNGHSVRVIDFAKGTIERFAGTGQRGVLRPEAARLAGPPRGRRHVGRP